MNSFSQKMEKAASPLLIIFAFAIPLSTSATSVLAVLLFLIWCLSGSIKEKLNEIFKNPVSLAVLGYILLHAVALLWTENMEWGFAILTKQWKLMLFPIFLTLTKKDHTNHYLGAFVAAIFLKACKAYLVWLGIISLDPSSIFTTSGTTHVLYNPMLAISCYIVLQWLVFKRPPQKTLLLAGICLFLFLSCNMFITAGRTGHVSYYVLLVVILFQIFYRQSKKLLFITLLCIPVLITATYKYSTTFRDRLDTAVSETRNFTSGGITSVGCRVWFINNTVLLIRNNWLIGTGTGDYPREYAKINRKRSPKMPYTDNPHNQYLLVLSQFGIIGLVSLLSIFTIQLKLAFTIKDNLTMLRQAFPIFFMVIMLAESYLQVYGTGFLFSLFSAFLYKIYPDNGS